MTSKPSLFDKNNKHYTSVVVSNDNDSEARLLVRRPQIWLTEFQSKYHM